MYVLVYVEEFRSYVSFLVPVGPRISSIIADLSAGVPYSTHFSTTLLQVH